MLNAITITRKGRRRDDAIVLDVLEELAAAKYGSATNAAVRLIQQHTEYADTLKAIKSRSRPTAPARRRRAC